MLHLPMSMRQPQVQVPQMIPADLRMTLMIQDQAPVVADQAEAADPQAVLPIQAAVPVAVNPVVVQADHPANPVVVQADRPANPVANPVVLQRHLQQLHHRKNRDTA